MKTKIIYLILLILLLTNITLSAGQPLNDIHKSPNHYIIVGHIYPPYNSSVVYLENIRTSEVIRINIKECEHNLKEYLFELANLKYGWKNKDKLLLTYDNKTTELIVNTKYIGIQKDINVPNKYNPISIITGTVLILSISGLYYYIKKKKINKVTK